MDQQLVSKFESAAAVIRAQRVKEKGPERVVINEHGEAIAPSYGCPYPDVVFIRHDGWSLGAPENLVDVAERLWADCWVAVIEAKDGKIVPYQEWKRWKATWKSFLDRTREANKDAASSPHFARLWGDEDEPKSGEEP